jgi:hypothetical protein
VLEENPRNWQANKQASKTGTAKHVFLLQVKMTFFKILASVFI